MASDAEDFRGDEPRPNRAEAQREKRRADILVAASALFSQRGYHETSIADVIEAAGISRGTFYLYFDGKDELFLELIEQFVQRIIAVVEVVDPNAPEPTQRIADNVRRVVDVVYAYRDLTVMVLREDFGVRADVDEKLTRFYGFVQEMVEGALRNGAAHRLTRKVDEPIVARALIGAFKEVLLHALGASGERRMSRQAVADALLDFGLRGLLLSPR
jgi:AcrR family transcriptional regulator